METLKRLLYIDQTTGKPSSTKLWTNVASIIALAMFPYAVIYGSAIGYELWLVILVSFLGNKTVNKIAAKRFDREPDK